jgi:hypothetical protein
LGLSLLRESSLGCIYPSTVDPGLRRQDIHVDCGKMSPATNYAEIQQDEVEALASIFMEEFREEEARKGAWNVGGSIFPKFNCSSSQLAI